MLVKYDCVDKIGFINFEWHSQNEVGNICILVLCRDHKQLFLDIDLNIHV